MADVSQFQIRFDGEALRSGLMDVRELAPSLLAVGDLIESANRVLNGDRATISVQVKGEFKTGSFPVALVVSQSLIEAAKDFLLHHPHIRDAKEILEILFFYGGMPATTVTTVFKFIKWLKGRSASYGAFPF